MRKQILQVKKGKWEGISKLKQRPVFDYTLQGLFWGCWHTLWPLEQRLCIKKNFRLMYKWVSDSNQSRVQEEGISTSLKAYNLKVTLNSPNCIYDLTKSLGHHRIYNFPFHTKDTKYSAELEGIVLKPQWNSEEFGSNFQHFRKQYEYFASKLLLSSQHFLT